jgi:hypothetical protein
MNKIGGEIQAVYVDDDGTIWICSGGRHDYITEFSESLLVACSDDRGRRMGTDSPSAALLGLATAKVGL